MIYNVLSSPIVYDEGTLFFSATNITLNSKSSVEYWIGGSSFTFPREGMKKIILRDKIGQTTIERVFVRLGKTRELFPISIKLYENGDTRLLLMKNGIGTLLHELNDSIKNVKFLDCAMVHQALNDVSLLDPVYASEAYDEICLSGYKLSEQLNNESVGITDTGTDAVKDFSKKDSNIEIDTKSIIDNNLSMCPVDNGERVLITPVHTMEDLLEPSLTDRYENNAYDTLTSLSAINQTLDKRDLNNVFGLERVYREMKQFGGIEGFNHISVFNSVSLTLANIIHSLPYFEFTCEIDMVKRILKWFNRVGEIILESKYDERILNEIIKQIPYKDVIKVFISKNQYDEVLIEFVTLNTKLKYFIDLTIVSMLSRTLVHSC